MNQQIYVDQLKFPGFIFFACVPHVLEFLYFKCKQFVENKAISIKWNENIIHKYRYTLIFIYGRDSNDIAYDVSSYLPVGLSPKMSQQIHADQLLRRGACINSDENTIDRQKID